MVNSPSYGETGSGQLRTKMSKSPIRKAGKNPPIWNVFGVLIPLLFSGSIVTLVVLIILTKYF